MTHNGNQLTRVVDNSTTTPVQGSEDFKDYTNKAGQYTYNRNGAMDKDTHKGILGIKYNSLNLPTELAVKNINTSGKTYYTYSASGVKLRVVHKDAKNQTYTPVMGTSGDSNLETSKVTDYVGNKVYENEGLKRILVDGGYIENNVYHYYLKDHLGNNRVVINQYNEQIQNSQYYPFGMAMAESTSQSTQPYKYNGKELDKTHGMNLYDYSARYYDGALGRFTTVDPLAELNYAWSPFAYVDNNPINFIDPDGRKKGDPNDPYELSEVIITSQPKNEINLLNIILAGQWANAADIAHGSSVRMQYYNPMNEYIRNNAINSAEYAMSRYHLAQSARAQMGPMSKSLSELQKSKAAQNATAKYLASHKKGTSGTTRAATNSIAKTMQYGGRAFVVTAAGASVYNIATSDNVARTTVSEVGGWTGAWAGAKGGAMLGASIGTMICPGIGTAVGTLIGGVIGGSAGYYAGSNIAVSIYDEL